MRFECVVAHGLLQVVVEGFSEEHLVFLCVLQLEHVLGKLPDGILHIPSVVIQGIGELGDVQGIVQPFCLEDLVLDLVLAFIESILAELDDLILKGNQVKGRLFSFFSPDTVNCLFARIGGLFSISRELHLGHSVDLSEFANQPQSRLFLASNNVGANCIDVDLALVLLHLNQSLLIQVI